MSYPPHDTDVDGPAPDDEAPPSHLSEFTVERGFSVIPPKRPGTVTAAATMMFVYAGLAVPPGLALLVTALDDLESGPLFALFRDAGQLLFAAAVAVGFAVVPMLVLRGRDPARVGAFVLTGAVAFVAVSVVIRGFAGRLLSVPGGEDFLVVLIATAVLVAVVITIVLLAGNRSDAWFYETRGERFINRDTGPPTRPRGVVVATIALGVIALTELVELTIQIVDAFSTDTTYSNPTSQIVYMVPDSLPILAVTLVAMVLVFFTYETARVLAFGLCGAIGVYFLSGVFDLASVLTTDFYSGIDGLYYVRRSLLLFQVVASVFVVTGLAGKPTAAWFRLWRDVRAEREVWRADELTILSAGSPSPSDRHPDSDWP